MNLNGRHSRDNGHDDQFDIGWPLALFPVNGPDTKGIGNAPENVKSNYDDNPPEPRKSLFSWAAFMAEPVGAGR